MEQIRRVLEQLGEMFGALVDLFEPLLRAVFEALLNVDIPVGGARTLTTVVLVLVILWLVSKAYLGVTKSTANEPMKIIHTTDKTPAQVVREDRAKHVGAWLTIGLAIAAIYLLTR